MGKKGGGNSEAKKARKDEQKRQNEIRGGTKRIGDIFGKNFDDKFFTGRRAAFTNYAAPQLEDQYGDAQRKLTFALARGGNSDSSVAAQKFGELTKLYDINKQKVADDALAHETELRTGVEDARSNLVATLNATGDAQGAANSALTRASALSRPAAYSPLAQLFTDFTAGLGTQAAMERAEAASAGAVKPRYSTGLFANSGRVSVT